MIISKACTILFISHGKRGKDVDVSDETVGVSSNSAAFPRSHVGTIFSMELVGGRK
jgi:hypothetical protein